MRARTIFAVVVALAASPQRSPGATAPDSFFGTWSLDRGRSHYAKEAPPDQMTIVIEPAPNGLAYRSHTQYAGGRTSTSLYVASFDGTPTLVVGSSGFLAPVSLRRVDDGTIEATYTSGLKKVAWSHWSVNVDGSELVVTTTYLGSQGEENRNVAAFHRAGV